MLSFFFFFVLLLLNESPLLKITAALVCLFVCLSFLMLVYLCVCVRVLKERHVCFIVVVPPPLFFYFFSRTLPFELLVVFAPCPPRFLFLLFFFAFSHVERTAFPFWLLCVCVCVCCCCLRRGASKSLNGFFFFPAVLSFTLPFSCASSFSFFLSFRFFFFCFSVSLQSVAE